MCALSLEAGGADVDRNKVGRGKGGYLYCILGYWGVVSVDPDHVHADLNP